MGKYYEVMYIIHVMDEEATEAVIAKVDSNIEAHGGKIIKTERWGKKKLAYECDGDLDGFYVLTTFDGSFRTVKALDNLLRYDENVMRFMVMRHNGGAK